VKLELGEQKEVVTVTADTTALNTETVEVSGGIRPETVAELPLIIASGAGGLRSAASFMTLLPGVVTPEGDVISAHMNGAQKYSGENLVNGISTVNPSGGNGTYSAAFDFGQSPEMVSELKVITANYEPQYGSTGGSTISGKILPLTPRPGIRRTNPSTGSTTSADRLEARPRSRCSGHQRTRPSSSSTSRGSRRTAA
jgi:hypothetical protein